MTFAISMVNNISLFHTKTQNYHLKYLNVIMQIRKLFIMIKNVISAISGSDTLKPLEI